MVSQGLANHLNFSVSRFLGVAERNMKRLKELMARTVLPEQIFLVSLAVSVTTCHITGNRQILLSFICSMKTENRFSVLFS